MLSGYMAGPGACGYMRVTGGSYAKFQSYILRIYKRPEIQGILSWLAGRCLIWVLFLGEPGWQAELLLVSCLAGCLGCTCIHVSPVAEVAVCCRSLLLVFVASGSPQVVAFVLYFFYGGHTNRSDARGGRRSDTAHHSNPRASRLWSQPVGR